MLRPWGSKELCVFVAGETRACLSMNSMVGDEGWKDIMELTGDVRCSSTCSGGEGLVAQLCLTLCDPIGCSPPGSSVHGILQARIVE